MYLIWDKIKKILIIEVSRFLGNEFVKGESCSIDEEADLSILEQLLYD